MTYALKHYTELANAFLKEYETKLQGMYVSDDDTARAELRVEADVVRVCGNSMIQPLSNAINIKYGTKTTVGSEVFENRRRADCSFNIYQDTKQEKAVMIIEFKRIGLIRPDGFEEEAFVETQVDKILRELNMRGEDTIIDGKKNVLVLTKQTTAYAETFNCPFVALCDYDKLVLLRFNLPDTAHVTTVPRDHITKSLLGFLEAACLYARFD